MALMAWGRDLEVGFGDIDVQHRRLVRIMNSLDQVGEAGGADAVTKVALNDLAVYTRVHFRYEEQLMTQHGLADEPWARAHRAEHQRLIDDLAALDARMTSDGDPVTDEVLDFLRNWLAEHILGTDRQLAKELLNAGATSAA